ncbi:hypothetical protein [Caballeronia grimmiae]|uniref:hypothetical protein n=1 Tax=Caballeronia grimmiae TaxID=1071679 RepID=UPI0038B86B73
MNELFEIDEDAAAVIDVVLEELCENSELVELLNCDRARRLQDPAFDNQKIEALWKIGYFIFRLKMMDFDGGVVPHRVLHATDGRTSCTHVLAIIERQSSYDLKHHRVQRSVADYDELGIYRG